MTLPKWIAVDWGTSNLRIWAMGENSEVLDEITSDQGMSALAPEEFEPALLSHIEPWLSDRVMPVIACGMVGARQGWIEAPYDEVPVKPAMRTISPNSHDPRLDVKIIGGLQQLEPADVMRGEETQIAGYLSDKPSFTGGICLPGTHSKWASIKDGKITHFQTVLTGELFDLLSTQSILRHSMGEWDEDVFIQEIKHSFATPNTLMSDLFSIRANQLLKGDTTGKSRLSGIVIGSELAALRNSWEGQTTAIIGVGSLAHLYDIAITALGGKVEIVDGAKMTLNGLQKVYEDSFRRANA